jgi:hypothetical protein
MLVAVLVLTVVNTLLLVVVLGAATEQAEQLHRLRRERR